MTEKHIQQIEELVLPNTSNGFFAGSIYKNIPQFHTIKTRLFLFLQIWSTAEITYR